MNLDNLYPQDSTKVILSYYGLERPPLKLYRNGEYEIIDYSTIEAYDDSQNDTVFTFLIQKGTFNYSEELIDFYTPSNYQNIYLDDDYELSFDGFPAYTDTISKYYRVYWGDKEFLINHFEIINYCNAINGGKKPSEQLFEYSWKNTKNIGSSVNGLPQLPSKYSEYIFSKPITCEIIGYEDNQNTFKINKGIDDGLFEGAIIYLDSYLNFNIVKTEQKTSVIESTLPDEFNGNIYIIFKQYSRFDEEKKKYDLAKETLNNLLIGTKLSTRYINN